MNRFLKVTLLSTSLALSGLAMGCGGSVATEQTPATAQAAATKAPVAVNAHGPAKIVGEALSEVPLRTDQRAEIEKLAVDAETRHASVLAAHKDLTLAIAAQVEAGAIDRAALQPKIDAATQAWTAARPGDRAALERLHAILDTDQRALFVDTLQANMKARHQGHNGHDKMAEWSTALKLTDAQQEQIKTVLHAQFAAHKDEAKASWKAGREHGKQVMDAFKGDRFVMDEVAPPVDAQAKANAMSDHILRVAEAVLPILTPDQRTLAANKLRARAGEARLDEIAP